MLIVVDSTQRVVNIAVRIANAATTTADFFRSHIWVGEDHSHIKADRRVLVEVCPVHRERHSIIRCDCALITGTIAGLGIVENCL